MKAKQILILLPIVLSLFGCGKDEPKTDPSVAVANVSASSAVQSVLGTWENQDNRNEMIATITITPNSFSIKAICFWPEGIVLPTAPVTVPASSVGDLVTIFGKAHTWAELNFGEYECGETVYPGKIKFNFSSPTVAQLLTGTNLDQSMGTFTRIQ